MLNFVKEKYECQSAALKRQQREVFQQHDEEALVRPDPEEVINRPDPQAEGQENPPNYYPLVLKLLLFMCAISVIVYGAIHLDDCPAQKMIAVSYIVMGGIYILSLALNSPHDIRDALAGRAFGPKPNLLIGATMILQLLMIGWFVASCYWVYHIESYIDKKDPKSPNYCSEDFYKYIYWGSTIGLALMVLFILIACCGCCFLVGLNAQLG